MKNTIKNIITWAVMIIAVLMMIFTVISVTTVDKTERNIAGYKMFIALSDSMSATDFEAGDLVVSKSINPYEITEGDIISFSSRNEENYGEVVTHKVREVTEDEDGDLAFRTYGTTTDTDDETLVSASYVLGKYQFRVPKLGYFFNFIHTVPGYIVCILTPFMLLIILVIWAQHKIGFCQKIIRLNRLQA